MIKQIEIIDNSNTPIYYLKDIPFFFNNRIINFSDNINIIVGPNGSGKSTLIKLICEYFLINDFCADINYIYNSKLFSWNSSSLKNGIKI